MKSLCEFCVHKVSSPRVQCEIPSHANVDRCRLGELVQLCAHYEGKNGARSLREGDASGTR